MELLKGIIALDIDGTITVEKHLLEEPVKNFLNQLIDEGWLLVFVTGRTFSFAKPILSSLHGPYFFVVQNGAAIFEMPNERLIKKFYLDAKLIPLLSQKFPALLIESGKESDDICYYQPSQFNSEELEYIQFRIKISPEKWVALNSFEELEIKEFAVGKVLGISENALEDFRISNDRFYFTVIRDPFRENAYLAHINAKEASKGHALSYLIRKYDGRLPVIVAGDDYNDVKMLEMGTIKIVMEDAPSDLHAMADIIAPSAEKLGIIPALKEAIRGRFD